MSIQTSAPPAADDPNTDATRERLVKSATEQFLKRGYACVSVRDVAAACDLTTGAIYNRFRSKLELLVAAIEARMDADLESSVRDGQDNVPTNPGEHGALEQQLTARAHDHARRSALRALLLEGAAAARRDPKVRASLHEEQLRHLQWWGDVYRNWQHDQQIDPDIDMEAVLMFLWAAELGLGMLEAYGIEPPSPTGWRQATELVLRGLRSNPAE